MKNLITEAAAIEAVGSESVEKVNAECCQFTNRVMDDGTTEFSASVECVDTDGDDVTLTAYYYVDSEIVESVTELDEIDWEIAGYEIV